MLCQVGILAALAAGAVADRPFALYVRPAIVDEPMLPHKAPPAKWAAETIRLTATPGEYESATFAILANEPLKDVRLVVSDLVGDSGRLPASILDIRVVKAWYQAGIGSIRPRKGAPLLAAELLLKDDGLIRVDPSGKRNLMRQTDADGRTRYVCISDPDPAKMPDVAPRDAATLQPFDVPARTLKQLWVTVHVPEEARAGSYRGTIAVRPASGAPRDVHVRLRVLPFRLRPSPLVQSIYYRAKLGPGRHPHKVNSEYKTEAQLEAELRDMFAHGLTHPTTYQPYNDRLPRVLEIRNRAGFRSGPLFTLGQGTGSGGDPRHVAALQRGVRKWRDLARRYGHDAVYFYGVDEASGNRLKAQRASWKAVRQAGGKVFVAGYRGSFELVGDLQDVLVFAGRPDAKEAGKYHGIGHRIFSYANPQCGCEQPARYRRNFGLLLWKAGFDGAMDYAYQHSFGHVWNDFDHRRYRDHVMAYPTVNGVIDTVQWEGYREGVDDTRYLATLLEAMKSASPGRKAVAREARAWLDRLDVSGDLDAIRSQMIEWILRLRVSAGAAKGRGSRAGP